MAGTGVVLMSCNFCNMMGAAGIDDRPRGDGKAAGAMVLTRYGAGESNIHIELDASAMVSVSSMSVCGVEHFEHVKIPTYVDGYARGVKYCPFCGEEL